MSTTAATTHALDVRTGYVTQGNPPRVEPLVFTVLRTWFLRADSATLPPVASLAFDVFTAKM